MSNRKPKNSGTPSARPDEDYVRFIPLGGLDEVGMNCAIIECNGSMLMVDCGLTFPETDSFGVDIIVPDWSYLMDNLDRLDGVVITHGHEDHIGALPFFLKEVDVPVYSGAMTIGMLRRKLQSHNLEGEVDLFAVKPGERLEIGAFVVEFVHVNHSVPGAAAIALETPLGRLLFTGDWKVDLTPIFEDIIDIHRLAEFGRKGMLALFGDSTNSESPGYSTSEKEVQRGLADVIANAEGRVIIAQFSSNLNRVSGILESAHANGRRVALLGHSLAKNFGIARELGFVSLPGEDVLIEPHELRNIDHDKVVVISTGSQAEPRSSLARMSYGDHNQIDICKTDTIVLSARKIPGNEYGISFMINNLIKRGATIVTTADSTIHGSGHAQQEELKLMMNLTRPRYLVPVHGEYRMRKHHAKLGADVGVPNSCLVENGDVLQFTARGTEIVGHVQTGRMLVDGKNVGDAEDMQLRDRRKLATAGILVAFAVMDRDTGEMISAPNIIQRGVVGPTDSEEMLIEAAERARQAVEQLPAAARRDVSEVKEAIRVHIRRYFSKQLDRKPVVIPVVHEV